MAVTWSGHVCPETLTSIGVCHDHYPLQHSTSRTLNNLTSTKKTRASEQMANKAGA
jgi:hypothetical protein